MDRYFCLGLLVLLLFCVCVFIDLAYLKKKQHVFYKTRHANKMMMMMLLFKKKIKTFLLTHRMRFSCVKKKRKINNIHDRV